VFPLGEDEVICSCDVGHVGVKENTLGAKQMKITVVARVEIIVIAFVIGMFMVKLEGLCIQMRAC